MLITSNIVSSFSHSCSCLIPSSPCPCTSSRHAPRVQHCDCRFISFRSLLLYLSVRQKVLMALSKPKITHKIIERSQQQQQWRQQQCEIRNTAHTHTHTHSNTLRRTLALSRCAIWRGRKKSLHTFWSAAVIAAACVVTAATVIYRYKICT